jgi:hypothetical protein
MFSDAQDNFTISADKVNNQGKVTFKVKQPDEQSSTAGPMKAAKKGGKKDKSGDDQEDPNKAGRMLKTEEIRDICDRH